MEHIPFLIGLLVRGVRWGRATCKKQHLFCVVYALESGKYGAFFKFDAQSSVHDVRVNVYVCIILCDGA